MNHLNLFLFCSGRRIERDQLKDIPTPRKKDGVSTPVPHDLLMDLIIKSITINEYRVVNEQFCIGKERSMLGFLQLEKTEQSEVTASDYSPVIAVDNNYQRIGTVLSFGHGVLHCDSLSFVGRYEHIQKNQNLASELPLVVHRAVGHLLGMQQQQANKIEQYKQIVLTNEQAHDWLVKMALAGVIGARALVHAVSRWHDMTSQKHTVWRLVNCVSVVLRDSKFSRLVERTIQMHQMLHDHYYSSNQGVLHVGEQIEQLRESG